MPLRALPVRSQSASQRRLHGEGSLDLFNFIGRGGGIRTHDPLRPRQVRYQAALRPDIPFHGNTVYRFGFFAVVESRRKYAAAAR